MFYGFFLQSFDLSLQRNLWFSNVWLFELQKNTLHLAAKEQEPETSSEILIVVDSVRLSKDLFYYRDQEILYISWNLVTNL